MSDYYQLFTVDDVQRDEAAILAVLAAMRDKRIPNDLKLLNYFNEIPVSYPAGIDYLEDDVLELTVHQTQLVAIAEQKMTFLKSAHFPHDVVAKVNKIRPEKKTVLLWRFGYATIRSERRESVRVKVMDKYEVLFRGVDFSFRGRLQDISLTGISFEAPLRDDLAENIEGEVSLFLPSGVLDMPATLLRIVTSEEYVEAKYILKLELTPRLENAIGQFIFQQQSEVIKEMKARVDS